MFIDREAAKAHSAGDIGPCAWKGLCGRPGNLDYVGQLEDRLGVEWPVEDWVFYCPVHTELAVGHAIRLFAAHQRFLLSDRTVE